MQTALIQLLFYQLVELTRKHSTVLIEEPEIHLHPKAQAELAEVLAETAKAEDKQIIMTTHSEHMSLGVLLTLVAEGSTVTTDDLAIYSFPEGRERVNARPRKLRLLTDGQDQGRAFRFLRRSDPG